MTKKRSISSDDPSLNTAPKKPIIAPDPTFRFNLLAEQRNELYLLVGACTKAGIDQTALGTEKEYSKLIENFKNS